MKHSMSKHGVIVGHQTKFNISDGGIQRTFYAVLWCQAYRFTASNKVNLRVNTPAQQILYSDLGQQGEYRISQYMREFMREAGIPINLASRTSKVYGPPLYFGKVSQAWAVRKAIERMLPGIRGLGGKPILPTEV